jgi:hypothetical protein
MDTERMSAAWMDAVASFNQSGDFSKFEELLAPGCHFPGAGSSRDEIMKSVRSSHEAGWLRHDILSISAAGAVMTTLARNAYTNGRSHHVASAIKFDPDGKIELIVTADDNQDA